MTFSCTARLRSLFRRSTPFGTVVLILSAVLAPGAYGQDDSWAQTVSKAANSVVSIQLSQLRNFNDARQGNTSATGFVVDAERGIILTNRHVVGAGPIRLSATFQNQERVNAVPLYRDPVHDFAFIRYDTSEIEYAQPHSLALRPDKVKTGMNIRVIGSDGGEQLSILNGTIARLDREVPSYGRYGYNDFNTFYLQAASSTSGGSSGSPVIDFDGDVVALNAAANSKTASSFFLPLYRIQHALEKLQANEPIHRGSLQTVFQHRPFRELLRLGLDPEVEQRAREDNPNTSGMMLVGQVMVGGVAEGVLIEGDVLVEINGNMITDFVELEDTLDKAVDDTVEITVVRQGKSVTVQSLVANLHNIEPKRYIEMGDSILQNLSIQHIRAMARGGNGVVVADGGYHFDRAGVPRGSVITSVRDQPINNIDDFLNAVAATPQDEKLRLGFYRPGSEYVSRVAQLDMNARWFGHKDCSRVDDARFWDCQSVSLDRAASTKTPPELEVPSYQDPILSKVGPSMVSVKFSIPFHADNVYASNFNGTGMIVDAELGLVSVDRNTVPVGVGDAEITFFGSTPLKAEVVFLHPRHNVALLQYDPKALGDASVQAMQFADPSYAPEGNLSIVGYAQAGTLRTLSIDAMNDTIIGLRVPSLPRFQQTPTDAFDIPNLPDALGGPIVDETGRVVAVRMSFAFEDGREIIQQDYALPASVLAESVRLFKSGEPYRSIDARLSYRSLATAREWGLSNKWLRRYNELQADKRRVIYVEQVVPSTATAEVLKPGDVILAVDGELVTGMLDLELRSQLDIVSLTVLSGGSEQEISLQTGQLNVQGTDRMVSWGGALFQEPMDTIGYFKSVDFPGVYIADTDEGSPALWDGLYRNRFVTAVDGEPVNNLDDLLNLVTRKKQDEITRLSLISMSGRKSIVTVEPEYNFWPTFEVRRTEQQWQRINFAE